MKISVLWPLLHVSIRHGIENIIIIVKFLSYVGLDSTKIYVVGSLFHVFVKYQVPIQSLA